MVLVQISCDFLHSLQCFHILKTYAINILLWRERQKERKIVPCIYMKYVIKFVKLVSFGLF